MSILIALTVVYAIACGTLGAEPGAPLWLSWPLPIWSRIAHDWRRPRAVAVRPDYTRIAMLEHELFGIEPKPGTAAAALVNAKHAAKALRSAGTSLHNEP
ncbi:hypothetical protein CG740_23015 [Streptomyces sp. CB01201]|uniref:hypothetical protein n=1 Tax=Streptomyces sp. CB01201 TaxID=2020324 RepID=UPI000C277A57|nr:hypothetical protein [Streptomyces sp. CB01201]PJN00780.1 hypothetical protein CG740_23015 [Streptomyces sp. CB01201]